jgi:UDP-N-acetylmuramyl pentapeptide phosphotransferase/UDP-N-acetylglucosamine-1-phosphate transferase
MFLFDYRITRTDVIWVDFALHLPFISVLVTILVVAGFTNAFNIIDGLNGLASGQGILIALFFFFMCSFTQQFDLAIVCSVVMGATLGFFVMNWPYGKLFLGDGGAYSLGFFLVCTGLLMVEHAPTVSPFMPILIGIHPLFEASFTIIRRTLSKGSLINAPDNLHLHSLLHKALLIHLNPYFVTTKYGMNSLGSGIILTVSLFFDLLTLWFYGNSGFLFNIFFLYCFFFIVSFVWLNTFFE